MFCPMVLRAVKSATNYLVAELSMVQIPDGIGGTVPTGCSLAALLRRQNVTTLPTVEKTHEMRDAKLAQMQASTAIALRSV